MVWREKLDVARCAHTGRLILALLVCLPTTAKLQAQQLVSDGARLATVQQAFNAGRWEEAANLAYGPADQPPELDFLRGLALAKLQRWEDSRAAFGSGRGKAPNDPRFLVELAGLDYKQRNLRDAKRELHDALALNAADPYTREFLGTLYFLEANLEAALKYWNPIDKPRLRSVSILPAPQLSDVLLHRAVRFNAPQVLTPDALLDTETRLDNLGVYSGQRMQLTPEPGGNYDAVLHLQQRNAWKDSWLQNTFSLLSGVPYATLYPAIYNIHDQAVNVTSLLRWDSEKRRAYVAVSTPLFHDPALRLRIYFDGRNENWNLTNTFFASGPVISDLNIRRLAGGLELRQVMNGRWNWSTGVEFANREFRGLTAPLPLTAKTFFTSGNSFSYWLRTDRTLLRLPEHRLTLDSGAEARVGREFVSSVAAFGALRGSIDAHWFPRATGDDYEMQARVRAGAGLGHVPFDELFQLGIERDNDLWLRGHAGTIDGRKGAAPLGRRYLLANWEVDKNVYRNGFFTLKLGPFLDSGAIADSSGLFGSQQWLWDTGAQCKLRVLGAVTVVFSYGRDLRGGRNVFYGTAQR
jgi:tetratricopeptide (TPR) repeat protein